MTDTNEIEKVDPVLTQNWTQTPNWFHDYVVPNEKQCVIKIVSAIIRQTIGYAHELGGRKVKASLSYKYFEEVMGMSRPAISLGIKTAIEKGYIEVVEKGHPAYKGAAGISSSYKVKAFHEKQKSSKKNEPLIFESKQLKKFTAQAENSGSKNELISTKEIKKQKERKNSRSRSKNNKAKSPFLIDFLERDDLVLLWRECNITPAPSDARLAELRKLLQNADEEGKRVEMFDCIKLSFDEASRHNGSFSYAIGKNGYPPKGGILGNKWTDLNGNRGMKCEACEKADDCDRTGIIKSAESDFVTFRDCAIGEKLRLEEVVK